MLPKGGGGRAGGFAPSPSGVVVLVENKPKAPQPFPTLSDCFFFLELPKPSWVWSPPSPAHTARTLCSS